MHPDEDQERRKKIRERKESRKKSVTVKIPVHYLCMCYTTKFSASISIVDITTFLKVDANTTAAFVAKDLFLSFIVS